MTARPHLTALAERLGIESSYVDLQGVRHITSDDTKMALVAAMGYEAATESQAEESLAAIDRAENAQLLAPVCVLPVSEFARAGVVVRIPAEWRGSMNWEAELTLEDGSVLRTEGRADDPDSPTLHMTWENPIPIGYHAVRVRLQHQDVERESCQTLILTPPRCVAIEDVLHGAKAFGLCANLYTLRSARNWGVGDLTDLAALIRWMGAAGGSFVGVNPLHALHNRGTDVSPYSPVSRLFRNPIYLDVTAVPEWTEHAAARAIMAEKEFAEKLARARRSNEVDYEFVWALKRTVLCALHQWFRERHAYADTPRGKAYAEYRTAQGRALDDYAIFMALVDDQTERGGDGRNWRHWPAEWQDPRSSAVASFRAAHAAEVDFHRFLQFELDRQLSAAAADGRREGLTLGLYPDLAIGTSPTGADVWANPTLFAHSARLGCPPDYYAPQGQEWGIPPIIPSCLRADAYAYWIQMLRANLAHSGALRIDHVIGLKRQFWIPAGGDPQDGAYVRQRVSELLGILALESVRHGAVIIGEDLGTVPEGFSALLRRWGILSCQVMYFQRGTHGEFLPSQAYSDRALVTATTHDHVPLAGYAQAQDLAIRRAVGVIEDDHLWEQLQQERQQDLTWLTARLTAEQSLPATPETPFLSESSLPESNGRAMASLCAGVYGFLNRTPAPLVGVMLDDVAGELDPVNVPGVGPDKLHCWSRKMQRPVESLPTAEGAMATLSALATRRIKKKPPASVAEGS